MKLDMAGLSVSDVLGMPESEARKRGLVEPGIKFVRNRIFWTAALSDYKRYAKWRPMDELPDEYKVTKSNPKPPLLTYGIPISAEKIDIYEHKHESERPNPGKPFHRCFAMHVLSNHVQYPLRLGFPPTLATEYHLVVVLYTNHNMRKRKLEKEYEEKIISMVKEALELDEDVRPRWDFDCDDPSVPEYGEDGDEN
ncbi:hypothetical protein Agabi119p4_11258 [Agaricus bisporus var. burnettii]|uniref:Uncharacterized protein n=1 Tax=Agaricus bisporus var. burnettii TaxID=192524 RepID=A0A8H7C1H8_AGABI|nr:hypothetical protein Agabi119p4_11258 [Agaricus bisporus var. burnettii]